MPPPEKRPRETTLNRLFFALLVTIGLTVQLGLRHPYFVGWFNDDAAYAQSAQSLAFHGLCPVCSQPLAPNAFGKGWPLFLAPFVWLLGGHVSLYPAVSLICSLVFVALAADVCRREFGRRAAFCLALTLFGSEALLAASTSLMSEPFYCALAWSILWIDSSSTHSKGALLLQGALASLCAFTRPEGSVVILALIVALALRKQGRSLALTMTSFTGFYFLLRALVLVPGGFHLGQTQAFYSQQVGELGLPFFKAAFMNQLLLLGRALVNGPALLDRALGALLLGGLLAGGVRSRPTRVWPGFWLTLATSAVLLLWPYMDPRYWIVTLPAFLLVSLRALPRGAWRAVLPGLLLLQVAYIARSATRNDYWIVEPTRKLYESLTLARADETVVTIYPIRANLLSHRRCVTYQPGPSLGPIARNMADQDADILVWENHFPLVRSITGATQVETLPRLELWLERSSMFEVLYRNDAGLIVRLLASKASLDGAFEVWRRANEATAATAKLRYIEDGLRLVPDFHELRALQILATFALEPYPADQARAITVAYLEQYPHDFELANLVIHEFARRGDLDTARHLASACLVEANRLGDPVSAVFEAVLRQR